MQVSKVIHRYGYSIADVAEKMGLSKSSLAKSISNSGNPSIGKIRQIAEIVNCDITEFFEDECKHHHEATAPALTTADRIRKRMQDKGLSTSDLATMMGVLPQSLSRTLRTGNYRTATIKAIADCLGCKTSDLTDEQQPDNSIVCPRCGNKIDICVK